MIIEVKKIDSVGIVLGGGISSDCKLSYDAQARIKKALRLLKDNRVQKLILTGRSSFIDREKTEAVVYADYLLKNEIKRNQLILEEQARDTIGNAIYSKKIILKRNLPNIILIITSKYHLKRALLIFNHIFGTGYTIMGIGCSSSLFRFLSFVKELEKTELDQLLLTEVTAPV